MTKNNVTTETILSYLEESVKNRQVLDADTWVRSALSLNVLISDEHDKLFELQQVVANMKMILMEQGDSAAKATIKVESTNEFKEMQKQKAKIETIQEHIRLAKLQSRMKLEEHNGY